MNRSLEFVKILCFSLPDSDRNDSNDLQQYAVVDFPDSTIPDDWKLIPNMPRTWVPIPLMKRRCEKNCCSMEAMPLQICKLLSIHKSRGMTMGQEKPFTKVVVYLPVSGNKCPGLELATYHGIACSRPNTM